MPVAWLYPFASWTFAWARAYLPHGSRCALAAVTGLLSLLLVHAGAVFLPVSTGRTAMALVGGPSKGHDLYAFVAGSYVLFAGRKGARAIWRLVKDTGALNALLSVLRWLKLMVQVRKICLSFFPHS